MYGIGPLYGIHLTEGCGEAGQSVSTTTERTQHVTTASSQDERHFFAHNPAFYPLYFRKCDVLNRGFSGYNTRWAKIILPRLIRKGSGTENPVAVTIFFGANDSTLKGKGTSR